MGRWCCCFDYTASLLHNIKNIITLNEGKFVLVIIQTIRNCCFVETDNDDADGSPDLSLRHTHNHKHTRQRCFAIWTLIQA